MDTRTGIIHEFKDDAQLKAALSENLHLTKLSRAERRKLQRSDALDRPVRLVTMRACAASRNKAKAARKARRIQRRK